MKGKKLLLGALALAMLCTVGGGTFLMANAAETQPIANVTIGEILGDTGYNFNGTTDDVATSKTAVSYEWTAASYARLAIQVTGTNSSSVLTLKLTSDKATTIHMMLGDGQWDWNGAYDSGAIPEGTTFGPEALDVTYKFSEHSVNPQNGEVWLLIYLDKNVVTDGAKTVIFDTLAVDGVNYTPLTYTEPVPDIPPLETSFKDYTEWKVAGGKAEACTLENLPEGDPKLEGAIDNGAAKVTFTDMTSAYIEIPLSQELTGWPSAWTNYYVKFKAENITQLNAYIDSKNNEKEDEPADAHAFCLGIMDAWNVTVIKSVTDGFKLASVNITGIFTDYAKSHEKIEKIVLIPEFKEGAETASIEFGGMTFGGTEAPVFVNDIGTPEIALSDWISYDGYVLAQDGELTLEDETKYTGLLVSYTSAIPANASLATSVVNYSVEKYPKLHIGFYATQDITLGVATEWTLLEGYGHTPYTAGYHEIDIDLTKFQLTESFNLRFYIDSGAKPEFEGERKVVFDSIVFHKDVEIFSDEATPNGLYNTPKYEDGKLTWTYDAKDAGLFYSVNIPVENWYKFNRYLHINVTFSHEMAFGIWGSGNAFLDNVHQNSTHPKYSAGTYDLWLAASTSSFVENATNSIQFYCDVNNTAEASLVKTVTINLIEFTAEAPLTSSPNTSALTVDYVARTVSFEETYEVATTAEFTEGTVLTSGAAITPGATLYLRMKDGTSAVTSITYPAVTLSKDDIKDPIVGSNYIRFSGTGYEYRLGDSTEWVDLGSWGNLEAEKEYTVHIRIKATATSFASEEVEYKVTTLKGSGSTTPGGSDQPGGDNPGTTPGGTTPGGSEQPGGDTPGTTPGGSTDNNQGCGGCGSSVIGYGSLGLVAIAAIALGCVLFIRRKHND